MDKLGKFRFDRATLVKEWVVSIQTPILSIPQLTEVMRKRLSLIQGHYDCCIFISGEGEQQFRSLKGSHGGAENMIQSVRTANIVISIPTDENILQEVFTLVYEHHVHEEPTIRVTEVWGARSNYIDDEDNPHKYWNRRDAAEIHGKAIG